MNEIRAVFFDSTICTWMPACDHDTTPVVFIGFTILTFQPAAYYFSFLTLILPRGTLRSNYQLLSQNVFQLLKLHSQLRWSYIHFIPFPQFIYIWFHSYIHHHIISLLLYWYNCSKLSKCRIEVSFKLQPSHELNFCWII